MSRRSLVRAILTDITPLQSSADYRRLWFGSTVSQLGQQMTAVAVAIQVYALTRSSFSVGLVGLFAFVPLVGFGLYGGAIADAFDRRKLSLLSSTGLWVLSIALALQAFLHVGSVALLYAVVAVQAACFAVNSPARSAIIPRLLPPEMLPAANALSAASMNLGFTVGPLHLAQRWDRREPPQRVESGSECHAVDRVRGPRTAPAVDDAAQQWSDREPEVHRRR